jgi:FkbM family methyltransferase
MRRRDFVTGMATGVAASAAGVLAWDRFRPAGQPGVLMPRDARMSFSQQGEDLVLFHALRDVLKVDPATYMDVGAAHPVRSSNTYLLYWSGDRGLLVEPNPMYCDLLRSHRPRDIVLQAGIGVTDQAEADYYEIKEHPMLNTFSAETVERLQKGKTESVVARTVKMPLVNINRAIQEHLGKAPDLLSTDVEGLDFAILQALDFERFRPGVICSEGVPMFTGGPSDIFRLLTSKGYLLRGGTMVNSIYVDGRRVSE